MATCKDFIKERKTAYSARFPFLTDSQVTAKLRRIWNASQGPGGVNELLPPTVGITGQSHRKRLIVQGSRVASLARLPPQAIKENTDIAHSKDIPACTRTSDAGARCDLPQTTIISKRHKSPLLASSLNTLSHSDPYNSDTLGFETVPLAPTHKPPTHSKATKKKSSSQLKSTKQNSSPVKATPTSPLPPHLWSLPRRTRSKTAALLRGEAPPSEQTTPSQSSQELLAGHSSRGETPLMPPLSVSESPSEEGRDRVKSSSPDESFVECTSKSSEPVSPVENPPLSVPQDALCDLFSPLHPDEQVPSSPLHHDSGNKPTRTLVGPARGTANDKEYCLFEDATDIFM